MVQLTSNLNDVAEAVSLGATFWYLFVARESRARSWWVLMSACLAFAAKGSGIVLLAPLGLFLTWNQIRASLRGRPWIELPVRTALLFGVGLQKPIENWHQTGNPFWPLQSRVLGHTFDGPVDPASFTWNGMHGLDCFFFTGEGDLTRMLGSWYDFAPGYEPNMTSGGFGPVHALMGVPALVAAALLLLTRRAGATRQWPMAAALGLFVLGLMGPNPWWPRHVLAASLGSIVLLGAILGRLPRWSDGALAFAGLALAGVALQSAATQGIESFRQHGVAEVIALPPPARAALPVGGMWPEEMISTRDAAFGPDDGLAYEAAVWLHAQFYPWNYGSRVVWIEPSGRPADYLRRLREQRIRWVVLRTPYWRSELTRLGLPVLFEHGDEVVLEVGSEIAETERASEPSPDRVP